MFSSILEKIKSNCLIVIYNPKANECQSLNIVSSILAQSVGGSVRLHKILDRPIIHALSLAEKQETANAYSLVNPFSSSFNSSSFLPASPNLPAPCNA